MVKTRIVSMLLLGSLTGLATSAIARAQYELAWKPWSELDRVTKSYVHIDSTIESRDDVFVAEAVLNPNLPPFLFVDRRSSMLCGSAGCSMEILAPRSGKYVPFQSWTVYDIQIKSDQVVNGWYPIVLSGNTWIYKNGKYILR